MKKIITKYKRTLVHKQSVMIKRFLNFIKTQAKFICYFCRNINNEAINFIDSNNWIFSKCFFDFYTGVKYRFRNEEKEYFLNEERIIESQKNNRIGIRVGLNIGFRF